MQVTQTLTNSESVPEELSFFSAKHPMVYDDEIQSAGYQRIEPVADTSSAPSFNLSGNDSNSYYDLSNTYLQLQYQALLANGNDLSEGDRTALAANPWSLISTVKVKLNNVLIGFCDNPGTMHHMKTLVTKGKHWMDTVGAAGHQYAVEQTDLSNQMTAASTTGHPGNVTANSTGKKPSFDPYSDVAVTKVSQTIDATDYYFVTTVEKNLFKDDGFRIRVDRSDSKQNVFLRVADLFPQLDWERVCRGGNLSIEFVPNKQFGQVLYGVVDDAILKISRAVLWLRKVQPTLESQKIWNDTVAKSSVSQLNFRDFRLEQISVEDSAKGIGRKHHLVNTKVFHPKAVYVAFRRKDRLTDITRNPLQFSHPYSDDYQIDNLQVHSNGSRCPQQAYQPAEETSRILQEFYRIAGIDEQESSLLTENNFHFQGIYAFDLTATDSSSFSSRSNAQIELSYNHTVQVGGAYDCLVLIESDGVLEIDMGSGIASARNLTF